MSDLYVYGTSEVYVILVVRQESPLDCDDTHVPSNLHQSPDILPKRNHSPYSPETL